MSVLDQEYPMWKAKADMVARCDIGSLPVLGDSKTLASISPNKISPQVVNFALGGASLVDMLAISRRILECRTPPRAVFISTSLTRYLDFRYFWERTAKFEFFGITSSDLEDFRRRSRQYGDSTVFGSSSPFDFDARLKTQLFAMRFPAYYSGALINSRLTGRKTINREIYEETQAARGQHYFGLADGSEEVEESVQLDDFDPSLLQRSLLDELLTLYQSHGIPVYMFSPALKQNDIRWLNPRVRDEYSAFLESYASRFPNFHFLGELFPTLPNIDFGDKNHVNVRGNDAWSRHFKDLLRENHLAP